MRIVARRLGLGGAAAACALGVTSAIVASSCSSNPINVPVRTFERAEQLDVVCLQVANVDANGITALAAKPVAQAHCAPVPPNTDTSTIPYHLFALVTQATRGEVAVVDLTGGVVVDEDRETPGINFIPVGAIPTDVAVAPDAQLTFVGSAEVNKPAIYAIDNARALGDAQGLPGTPPPLRLTDLPVCGLPQAPGALAIVPRAAAAGADGGADASAGADGGGDAGTGGGGDYTVVAVLPGNGQPGSAKVVTLDPKPFMDGTIGPGSLAPCKITGAIELGAQLPASWTPGPAWDDGVKYASIDTRGRLPSTPGCGVSAPAPAPLDGGTSDGGDAGGTSDAGGAPDAGDGGAAGADAAVPFAFGPLDPPRANGAALALDVAHPTLYVADESLPIIHVVDLTDPSAPRELEPLLATSINDPVRRVSVRSLAVSPATRDFKRYLYAIDEKEGTILVYDVTDPATSPRTPLVRPHAELDPFEAPDRIAFTAPVAAVSFVRHDWPLPPNADPGAQGPATSGLLCNPNPNAAPGALPVPLDPNVVKDPGAYYRNDAPNQALALGPARLRGVFAFVTLTNGQLITIDVDDWDAPCRRPDPMTLPVSDRAPAEPAASSMADIDPFHAPTAYQGAGSNPTTLETFFPVSAPNRPRSRDLLRNDPQLGIHIPNLVGTPQLYDVQNGARATTGTDSTPNPKMLPTRTDLADWTFFTNPADPNAANHGLGFTPPPSTDPFNAGTIPSTAVEPSVRFAWEEPQTHFDQDWNVSYEGAIPGFDGLPMTISSNDGFFTAILSNPNGQLCRRGVEDRRVATQRVDAELAAMDALGVPRPAFDPHQWRTDYIQIIDEIVDISDPYWLIGSGDAGDNPWAWSDDFKNASAQQRHDLCANTYGTFTDNALPSVERDFPILEAYDDHLVISRFGYPDPKALTTTSRVISPPDKSNAAPLQLMKACFHNQITFRVRAAGEWVVTGSNVGFLHHVTTNRTSDPKDPLRNACVLSCDPLDALLNGRAPELPWSMTPPKTAPDRNSPLALRNPSFSFVMWAGQPPAPPPPPTPAPQDHTTSPRDLTWKFSTRGQFNPLTINIAGNSTSVSPQSMRFIESLGQLAIVDGASQGLVLVDLNTVALAHAPFF